MRMCVTHTPAFEICWRKFEQHSVGNSLQANKKTPGLEYCSFAPYQVDIFSLLSDTPHGPEGAMLGPYIMLPRVPPFQPNPNLAQSLKITVRKNAPT